MTTLKQLLEEKILCSDARTVIPIVKEWLLQKRQEVKHQEYCDLCQLKLELFDKLLEELK